MPTIVVPHRPAGKSRLETSHPGASHSEVVQAMLEDVLAACLAVDRTMLVTPSAVEAPEGVEVLHDDGRGQGEAVAGALAQLEDGAVLVVNSDLPCVTPGDLELLRDAIPPGGLALVAAEDGTTNALALSTPRLFQPLYGPGSAARFRSLAPSLVVHIPNLEQDVDRDGDWPDSARLGPRTRAALRIR